MISLDKLSMLIHFLTATVAYMIFFLTDIFRNPDTDILFSTASFTPLIVAVGLPMMVRYWLGFEWRLWERSIKYLIVIAVLVGFYFFMEAMELTFFGYLSANIVPENSPFLESIVDPEDMDKVYTVEGRLALLAATLFTGAIFVLTYVLGPHFAEKALLQSEKFFVFEKRYFIASHLVVYISIGILLYAGLDTGLAERSFYPTLDTNTDPDSYNYREIFLSQVLVQLVIVFIFAPIVAIIVNRGKPKLAPFFVVGGLAFFIIITVVLSTSSVST